MLTYRTSDRSPVPHQIQVGFPPTPVYDLSGRSRVVHGMGSHDALSVGRPIESQDRGRATTLREIINY